MPEVYHRRRIPLSSAAVTGPFTARVDPLVEFQVATSRAFAETVRRAEEAAADPGPAAERRGDASPSSTWTYLLADNPFSGWLEGVMSGLMGKLRRLLEEPRR